VRLWSIHPRYLDRRGLLALWREALLAQKVLKGETRGYTHHPQLERFRTHPDPQKAIADYLLAVWDESKRRGYHFDRSKIDVVGSTQRISVTYGQLRYEFAHLLSKLHCRDSVKFGKLESVTEVEPHPLFHPHPGEIEEWERTAT
jgi:hypothetical protein